MFHTIIDQFQNYFTTRHANGRNARNVWHCIIKVGVTMKKSKVANFIQTWIEDVI